MVERHTFKVRHYRCVSNHKQSALHWDYDAVICSECPTEQPMFEVGDHRGESAAVHGDEIDVEIRHGLCNPDGSPRRYRSLTELKRDAYAQGWSVHGDTPNPNPRIVEERQRAREEGRPSRA